jgi:hypothetical protein
VEEEICVKDCRKECLFGTDLERGDFRAVFFNGTYPPDPFFFLPLQCPFI